jgi:hypothetical protein
MNGIARTPRRTEASYHLWLGLTLLGAGSLFANRVEASAIVHSGKIDKAEAGSSWSEYLLGGPRVWDTVPHPPVTEAVKQEIRKALKTDPGGTSLMVQFLLNKQSLDPARFDHYHPNLVGPLARIAATIPSTTTSTSTSTTTGAQELTSPSTTAPTTAPTEAQTTSGDPSPQIVPEPEALLLAIGMAGWAVWWRRRLS